MLLGILVTFVVAGCAEPAVAPDRGDSSVPGGSESPASPQPPRIPTDFTWTGRYLVPDLDLEVPFTWHGNGGDFQMIAGGEDQPIHFTNLIYEGQLYTYTYKWPGIPRQPCSHVGPFTLDELNRGFSEASFVGRETLHGEVDREVHHFRSVGVIDLPPGLIDEISDQVPLRLPVMAGDVYVDVDDPSELRQLLHFGLQNLYDPNLDEWIVIEEVDDAPGEVSLPPQCSPTG